MAKLRTIQFFGKAGSGLWFPTFFAIPIPSILIYRVIALLSAIYLLASCVMVDLLDPSRDDVEGFVQIRITPNQSVRDFPAMSYHFYNTNPNREYIVRYSDESGNYEGMLPVGSYRVIATNASAEGVKFSGMNSYESAMVSAKTPAQPDDIYSTLIEKLLVTASDSAFSQPIPLLLTRRLNLSFTIQSDLDERVVSLTGVLHGLRPSLYLSGGYPAEEGEGISASFEAHKVQTREGNTRRRDARIRLFGIVDLKKTGTYRNRLDLLLTMNNGTMSLDLDLTDVFSELLEKNKGEMPVEVEMNIELKTDDVNVVAEVVDWNEIDII